MPTDKQSVERARAEEAREFRKKWFNEHNTESIPARMVETALMAEFAALAVDRERELLRREERLAMIERLKTWIGRVGHEDYYKSQAKLLEFEHRAETAEAKLRAQGEMKCQ